MAIQQLPPLNTRSSSTWLTTAGQWGRWMVSDWTGRIVGGITVILGLYLLSRFLPSSKVQEILTPCLTEAGQQYGCINEKKYLFKNPIETTLQLNISELISNNLAGLSQGDLQTISIQIRSNEQHSPFFCQQLRSLEGLEEIHLPRVPSRSRLEVLIIGETVSNKIVNLQKLTLNTTSKATAYRLKKDRWESCDCPALAVSTTIPIQGVQAKPAIHFERNQPTKVTRHTSQTNEISLFNDTGEMRAGVLVLSNINCPEAERNISYPFAVPHGQDKKISLDTLKIHWMRNYELVHGQTFTRDVILRILAVQDTRYENVFPISWG